MNVISLQMGLLGKRRVWISPYWSISTYILTAINFTEIFYVYFDPSNCSTYVIVFLLILAELSYALDNSNSVFQIRLITMLRFLVVSYFIQSDWLQKQYF